MRAPTIGRIVVYRTDGRNGLQYDLPAIVTCTRATHPGKYPGELNNPLPVPESALHVHLTVFTPGGFGARVLKPVAKPGEDPQWVGATSFEPGSGTYVELNVPPWEMGPSGMVPARTWRWPEIVTEVDIPLPR